MGALEVLVTDYAWDSRDQGGRKMGVRAERDAVPS
jgi:hypothetical protein